MNLDAGTQAGGPPGPPGAAGWAWVGPLTSAIARAAACSLAGLLLWAQLPALVLGWTATVVQSGSMRPALAPGDVVLYQPSRGGVPAPGQIVLARDPARPESLLTHRVHRVLGNNDLVVKGDANPDPDSTPLHPSSVLGVARLRVPWVGLPIQLWRAGRPLRVAMLVLGLAVLLALAVRPPSRP